MSRCSTDTGKYARRASVACSLWVGVLCAVCAFADSAQATPPEALRSLKAKTDRQTPELRGLVLSEVVAVSVKERPVEEAKHYGAVADEILRQRTIALEHSDSKEALEATLARYDERLARLDRDKYIRQLNREYSVSRTRTIDLQQERMRLEDVDLRDIQRIMEDHGLEERDETPLSKSQIAVIDKEKFVRLFPEHKLAGILIMPGYDDSDVRIELGMAPAWLWEAREASIETSETEPPTITISGVHPTRDQRFRAVLRKDLGNLVSRLTLFLPDGGIAYDFEAMEFRDFDGFTFPSRTRTSRGVSDMVDFRVEVRSVQNVQVERELAETLFEIPAEFYVQDTRPQ